MMLILLAQPNARRQLWSTAKGSALLAHFTGFHAVALLCAPPYRVPSQRLYESLSAVPPLPSSLGVTLGGTT